MPNCERKYMKWDGSKVIEMTQQEKDAVDDQILADQAQQEENSKDITLVFEPVLRAFALVVLDEINILRTQAGFSERTTEQLVNAVKG